LLAFFIGKKSHLLLTGHSSHDCERLNDDAPAPLSPDCGCDVLQSLSFLATLQGDSLKACECQTQSLALCVSLEARYNLFFSYSLLEAMSPLAEAQLRITGLDVAPKLVTFTRDTTRLLLSASEAAYRTKCSFL